MGDPVRPPEPTENPMLDLGRTSQPNIPLVGAASEPVTQVPPAAPGRGWIVAALVAATAIALAAVGVAAVNRWDRAVVATVTTSPSEPPETTVAGELPETTTTPAATTPVKDAVAQAVCGDLQNADYSNFPAIGQLGDLAMSSGDAAISLAGENLRAAASATAPTLPDVLGAAQALDAACENGGYRGT